MAPASSVSDPDVYRMIGAPLVFNPTYDGFSLHVVLESGDVSKLRAFVRLEGDANWGELTQPAYPAEDAVQWSVEGLEPGTHYDYRVAAPVVGDVRDAADGGSDATIPDAACAACEAGTSEPRSAEGAADAALALVASDASEHHPDDKDARPEAVAETHDLFRGSVVTQRPPGESFSFAMISDTHIAPRRVHSGDLSVVDSAETTLMQVGELLLENSPDFLINLGDMLDFHQFGFNAPPPDGQWTRWGYLNYRRLLLDSLGHLPHFAVIGNWDGENGNFSAEQIAYSREQRLRYLPGPEPSTYGFEGSPHEDYYAFTWGDASFVVLNVMTYTPTSHALDTIDGQADDWTLGGEQLAWFQRTLEQLSTRWRFVLIHHTVGGAAGDADNAAYGRGGGQAAGVGEQALVHDLMQEFDVQVFFYGHDHVFTDMVVDGIHYTLPGSAGAPWKFPREETGYAEQWEDSGFAEVDVSAASLNVRFVNVEGRVIHDYSLD